MGWPLNSMGRTVIRELRNRHQLEREWAWATHAAWATNAACIACSSQTCALQLEIELGHSATSASVRHSVWKRKMRSFSCADRVGVALERCPGIPSFGRWRARIEGIWVVARAAPRFMEPQPIDTVRIAHQRRLHQSSVGGDAACERCLFSRERIGRRRASEAGARASTSREPIASTRLVGAGRARSLAIVSDAMGEQPGLGMCGSRQAPGARCITDTL